jgi:phage-related protein
LINPSTIKADAVTVATRLGTLGTVYSEVGTPTATLATANHGIVPSTMLMASPMATTLGDKIAIVAGDLFQWLKSGVAAVIDIIKDVASNAWQFIATIAGKVYRAVLDTVDAVVGAAQWVFNAIKTGIDKIIQYVKFLFDWADIRRTKNVTHNLVKRYLKHQVNYIPQAKAALNEK